MREPAKPVVQEHYHVFDTSFGACGVAWNERGVTRVQLPERTKGATTSKLNKRVGSEHSEVPPPVVGEVIASLQQYFAGERVDFGCIALDLSGVGPFRRKVYDAARAVGWGQTATYGDLARWAGSPGAASAVGPAMGHNPVQ